MRLGVLLPSAGAPQMAPMDIKVARFAAGRRTAAGLVHNVQSVKASNLRNFG